MKIKIILFFTCLCWTLNFQAQFSNPIQHIEFNTGINLPSGGGTSLLAPFQSDQRWQVSTTGPNSGFVPAIKLPYGTPTSPNFWSPELAGTNQYCHGWIGTNFNCTSTGHPANHMCIPGTRNLYFRVVFSLPVNPVLVLDWDMTADDEIVSISVNGLTTYPSGPTQMNTPIKFRWCKGWISGTNTNTIIVQVRSGPVPATNPVNNWAGLHIVSWGTNPANPLGITGSPTVCNNSFGTYSVQPLVPGAISYNWIVPGWTSNSSTNTVTPYFGNQPVVITAYANSPAGCVWASTLAVTPILPIINITSSAPNVCANTPFTLTATGGSNYTWTPGNSTSNPLIISQSGGTNYNVTATDANGCKGHTSLIVGVLPTPTLNLTAMPSVICFGRSNTLSAVGNVTSYTWLPSGAGTNTTLVTPISTPATYSVMGTGTNGCTGIAGITLTPGQYIPLTASNTTVCPDLFPCTTISAATSFSGAPIAYSWQPASGGTASITVCPTVNTIYTVSASSPSACSNSATLEVRTLTCCPPSTESFVLAPSNNCNGYYYDLAQYASVTGTFSGPGVSFLSGVWQFNPNLSLPAGTYTVAFTYTTVPYGCSYTLYDYITITSPFPIIATSPVDYCAYDPQGAAIGATVVGAPALYWWSWGPTTQNWIVTPSVTTTYWVLAFTNSCTSTASVIVNVNYTCCPQASVTPVLGTNFLSAGGNLNGPIIIDQDLTIGNGPGTFLFQHGDFIMGAGVKIIVKPGVTLELGDVHMYSCGAHLWKGIEVLDGANVVSVPGSSGLPAMIEDAETAIDVDNITSAAFTPLLNLDGVIFNRNRIGIRFHNSSLDKILVSVKSCVFTNRDILTATMSWPGSSLSYPDLRYATSPTPFDGLGTPFLVNPTYPTGVIKDRLQVNPPVTNRDSIIGIVIDNINPSGVSPSPGVDLTAWAFPTSKEFNLFDNLTRGIDVTDASLTTINNTFQNMVDAPYIDAYGKPNALRGTAIHHKITGQMNARLSLTPQSGASPGTGNRFWDCRTAIKATDVFEFDIEKATFRASPDPAYLTLCTGIDLNSNRFSHRILNNEFSNLSIGIGMNIYGAAYIPVGGGLLQQGINADNLIISQNYFGAHVNTSLPLNNGEYLHAPIVISGGNLSAWSINSQANFIQSNVIDRAVSGIRINETYKYPIEISNNSIGLMGPGIGLELINTMGEKVVTYNMVFTHNNSTNSNYLYSFTNNYNPVITCNSAFNGYAGFYFGDQNVGTWMGNTMEECHIGLFLEGIWPNSIAIPAEIGQQGSISQAAGNRWYGLWQYPDYHTWTNNPTIAANSPLYVNSGYPHEPLLNGGYLGGYSDPASLIVTSAPAFQCTFPSFPSQPQLRSAVLTDDNKTVKDASASIAVYPNPTTGKVTIISIHESEILQVKVMDITGKLLLSKTVYGSADKELDLSSLKAAMYFIEIQTSDKKIVRKKLIKN